MNSVDKLNYTKAIYAKRVALQMDPNAKVRIVDPKARILLIDKKLYRYQIRNILDTYQVDFTPVKVKSRKGILKSTRARSILLGAAALAIMSSTTMKENVNNQAEHNVYAQEMEVLSDLVAPTENFEDIVVINEAPPTEEVLVSEPEKEPFVSQQKNTLVEEDVISLVKPISDMDELGFEKKDATILEFGNSISYYGNRYGIDSSLLVALFTQERSNDRSSSGYNNVGQLTESICGEKIEAPVFESGNLIGVDKLYVLPSCYDSYPLEDLSSMQTFPSFTANEQEKIQQAVKLQQEGYMIYRLKDVKENSELNIRVSVAYLAYLINMKHDVIKGVASYNMGYPSINSSVSREDILSGELSLAGDPNYLNHIFRYLSDEELANGFTIYYEDGSCVHYTFSGLEEKMSHSL